MYSFIVLVHLLPHDLLSEIHYVACISEVFLIAK